MAICLWDDETTGRRDYGTTGLRDCETARPRDDKTTRLRAAEKHSRSQSFSGILSCARQLGVRVLHTLSDEINFCQKGLDAVLSRKMTGWGCTWAYIPIQTDEGSAADSLLSQKLLGVRVVQMCSIAKESAVG